MRSISLAATLFVAAAGLAFAQVDPASSQPPAPATETSEPAPAPATTDTPAQANEDAQSADQRVTCRTVRSTESRLRRNRQRICGTRAQWEQMQDQNADQIRNTGSVQGQTG